LNGYLKIQTKDFLLTFEISNA